MNPTCKTCRWWSCDADRSNVGDYNQYFCRRHSPTAVLSIHVHGMMPDRSPVFPLTYATDFCGDHQPIPG